MKFWLILLAMSLSTNAYTQQRTPPAPAKQLPGKDAVMVIENIAAGKSKQYNWHGNKAKIAVSSADGNSGSIDLWMDKKALLKNYRLTPNEKTISLSLTKKVNNLIITANKKSNHDIVKATIVLAGGDMTYHINLDCTKSSKDTIIIKR